MTPKEIEARREALKRELFEVGYNHGMPTFEAQKARNDRMAQLQRQIDELQQPEPQLTGEAAGTVQIGAFLLGSPPPPPPPREPSEEDRRNAEDPFYQFALESGQAPE